MELVTKMSRCPRPPKEPVLPGSCAQIPLQEGVAIRFQRGNTHNCGDSGEFKEGTVYRGVGRARGMTHAQGRQGGGSRDRKLERDLELEGGLVERSHSSPQHQEGLVKIHQLIPPERSAPTCLSPCVTPGSQ